MSELRKGILLFIISVVFIPSLLYGDLKTLLAPDSFFGFEMGEDYHLATWDSIVAYFEYLDKNSPKLNVQILGESTLGNPLILVVISDSVTLSNLDYHKNNQRMIADPRLIAPGEEKFLINKSKPVVLLNCQLHSTEIASSQMSVRLAYELITREDSWIKNILDRVIILIIPCANPDGHQMVVEYYRNTLGTAWEGGRMPWLYHKYAGHDNNRDWFMLNLKETRIITRLLYEEWFPTVVWDIHQTRKNSYRMFLPPFRDPRNKNMFPIQERMLYVLGGQMAAELTAQGKKGVIHGVDYDNYWAGGFRTTVLRHNIFGLLSEAASVNIASPIFLEYSKLSLKGREKYEESVNFPDPWPGGWWRLKDILEYEKAAAYGLLKYVARYHDWLQENYIKMGREAIQKGLKEPPFAWIIPSGQRDRRNVFEMLSRLHATGIEVHVAREAFVVNGNQYPAGTFILFASQPYRAHLLDMMERQCYPAPRKDEIPYDMAGWTFPLLMGVKSVEVEKPFKCSVEKLRAIVFPQGKIKGKGKYYLVIAGQNDLFRLANRLVREGVKYLVYTRDRRRYQGKEILPGSLLIPSRQKGLKRILKGVSVDLIGIDIPADLVKKETVVGAVPRIAIYQPWTASIDEGWTRYVLDEFEFGYDIIHDEQIRNGGLSEKYDCIILPSVDSNVIIEGNRPNSTFPQYVGGIGKDGIEYLQQFVRRGGTLICIDASCDFAIDHFGLPLKNLLKGKNREEFYCPGSILRLYTNGEHPICYGLDDWFPAYFRNSRAFAVCGIPEQCRTSEMELVKSIDVVATYSSTVLLESGWIRGEELIKGKPAIVEVQYGDGRIILFGVRIQNRAQTHGTFLLLFNGIYRSVIRR